MNPLAQRDSQPSSLPGWLLEQAAARPRAVALRHKRLGVWQERSWDALRVEVGALAGALSERGFRPGSTLTLLSNPRPEAVLLALAAQWLGGVAAVLDPRGETAAPDLLAGTPGRDFVFAEGLAEVERVRRAGLRPTFSMISKTRSRTSAAGRPSRFRPKAMFCSTVRCGKTA